MFKNETHNHPTEIEPFGGAATCIGGCIRDPLSGRAYVYQAMRVTGCGDPRTPCPRPCPASSPAEDRPDRRCGLPSYGNQIGLATGLVSEVYDPGYVAKHLEVGAVVGAAPAENVVRERPAPGDVVILLGGRTGRDGIGGATGSSQEPYHRIPGHLAAEVQKGNAPRSGRSSGCSGTGPSPAASSAATTSAPAASMAIGELADGLDINLDAVPKKYEGLTAQSWPSPNLRERMAVVARGRRRLHRRRRARRTWRPIRGRGHGGPRMVMRWRATPSWT